jgi:hypothetical protein
VPITGRSSSGSPFLQPRLISVAGLLACVLWVGYFVPAVIALFIGYRVYTNGQVEFPFLTQVTASVFKDM